jgi:hypothetical protein
VSAVLCGGKRMADAKRKAFVGGIRHCDPALCWQGALFRHLIITYTLCKVPFPTITDDKTWYNAAIWPVSDPTKNVDYDTLARQLSSLLVELGIVIGKVLHSFRVYAAQFLDEQGVADEVGGDTAVCTRQWSTAAWMDITGLVLQHVLICTCHCCMAPHQVFRVPSHTSEFSYLHL